MATTAAAVAVAGASLVGSAAGTLFSYNKAVFILDQTLRQWAVHQVQDMRIAQIGLYREDLRDLFGLTISRMDTYMTVNSVGLAVAVHSIYCGMIPPDIPQPRAVPSWLWFIWILNLSASTVLLLLSVSFSLHASIVAQSLEVKLLTRWLRLPLPTMSDIDNAADTFERFECNPVRSILRVPLVQRLSHRWQAKAGSTRKDARDVGKNGMMDHAEDEKYTVSHFSLFQRLQKAWLGYDSYARVFMVLATNQTLMTLSDFALGSTMVGDHEVWGAWAFVVVVTTAAMLHIRMNLTFESYNELLVMIVLTYLPPLTATVAATLDYAGQASTGEDVALASIAFHCLWYYYLVLQALEVSERLPRKFNIVSMSSDILRDENPLRSFVVEQMTEGRINKRRPGDFEWDYERNGEFPIREDDMDEFEELAKKDEKILGSVGYTDHVEERGGNKEVSQLALMEEGHGKIGNWVEAHYGQSPAPEDRWKESCLRDVNGSDIVEDEVCVSDKTSGSCSTGYSKNVKVSKKGDPCDNIGRFCFRPWSVYKQISAVISGVWAVGFIWWTLVCAGVPTGNDLSGPVFEASSSPDTQGLASFPTFFTPIGLDYIDDGSVIATDGISSWPRSPYTPWNPTDVIVMGSNVMVANGTELLVDSATGEAWRMPIRVDKVAYISEGRLAVSTPDNCLYLLQRDDDNDDAQWHRTAKIGDYSSDDDDIISGIAFSRDYYGRLLVLMRCGDIHIWNMSSGKRIVTHLTLPNVKRYTAIATTRRTTTLTNKQQEEEEYIMVSALGKDQRVHLLRVNEEVTKFLEK